MEYNFLYPDVQIGERTSVGRWCEIGMPVSGGRSFSPNVVIGSDGVIRSMTVLYTGGRFGRSFATGHRVLVRECVNAGDFVSIGSGTEIEQHTNIGNRVRIHSNCFIAESTQIDDDVRIAPGVKMASDRHPLIPTGMKNRRGPRIMTLAYIGMGAVILPGITIGAGSFVGAGSVVTRDVQDNVVVFGNPARVFATRAEYDKHVAQSRILR